MIDNRDLVYVSRSDADLNTSHRTSTWRMKIRVIKVLICYFTL